MQARFHKLFPEPTAPSSNRLQSAEHASPPGNWPIGPSGLLHFINVDSRTLPGAGLSAVTRINQCLFILKQLAKSLGQFVFSFFSPTHPCQFQRSHCAPQAASKNRPRPVPSFYLYLAHTCRRSTVRGHVTALVLANISPHTLLLPLGLQHQLPECAAERDAARPARATHCHQSCRNLYGPLSSLAHCIKHVECAARGH